MKILIQWRTVTPSATEIAGQVSQKIGYPVMPEYDEQYKRHGVAFECGSLHMRITTDLRMNGMIVANRIMQWLWDNYQIHGERMVDGWDVGAHACMLERRVRHLEKAVTQAIEDLKQTRSWLKDRRFGEIRRSLEQALVWLR